MTTRQARLGEKGKVMTTILTVKDKSSEKKGYSFYVYGLDPNVDYKLKATYKGASSSEKTVSKFDSHSAVRVDLHIDWNKQIADGSGS